MRYSLILLLALPLAMPRALEAQQQSATEVAQLTLTEERLQVFVTVYAGRARIQQEFDRQLAALPNKTVEAQRRIREERQTEVQRLHEESAMSEEEYNRIQFVIASDNAARDRFELLRGRTEQP